MSVEKQAFIHALDTSVRELQQGIEAHCCLLSIIIDGEVDIRLQSLPGLCNSRSREQSMRAALKEAITVLEESRKAFKSKRLEVLRKKLTQVLLDSN